MFGLFKKKQKAPASAVEPDSAGGKPRGVLPTYLTAKELVLCKAGPVIRNTYEIRLALYKAMTSDKRFVLAVTPEARVDDAVAEHLGKWGGEVRRGEVTHHAVYFGCLFPDGSENGWTLGDDQAMTALRESFRSTWLREILHVGALIPLRDLIQFGNELWNEEIALQNIDGENVKEALLELMVEALKAEGAVFVQ